MNIANYDPGGIVHNLRFFYTVAFYVVSHRLFSTSFSMAQQPLVGQALLIIEAASSLSDTTFGRTPLDE
jgi:hypothetical protein